MLLQLIGLYTVPGEVLNVGSALAVLAIILLAKRAIQAGIEARGWSADRAILLLWWGPPVLAAAISQLGMPIFLPRTLAATIIPAILALAGALARIESARERVMLTAALVVALIPTSVQIALRPPSEEWGQVAAYLNRQVRPGDEVWLYPNDSALPLREAGLTVRARGIPGNYPANGIKGPIRAGSPAVISVTAAQANAIATDPITRSVPTIWVITRQKAVFDPKGEFPAYGALGLYRGNAIQPPLIVSSPFNPQQS
jgi:hypothetical protein